MPVPPTMPPGGRFTGSTNVQGDLYYWTPATTVDGPTTLHRSAAGTGPWEQASGPDGLVNLLVLAQNLFGVTIGLANEATPTPRTRERILHSTDHGRSWVELAPPLPPCGQIQDLFPDPDHPGRVCVHAIGLRMEVLQTTDANDAWQTIRGSVWDRQHPNPSRFFEPYYASNSHTPMTQATLDNYFALRFGDAITQPALTLFVDAPRTFHRGAPMPVQVQLGLSPGTRPSVVVDGPEPEACWGLRWIGPDGAPEASGPKAPAPGTPRALPTPWRLTPETPLRRTLDLSALAQFRQTGRHRVQVVYSSFDRADKKRGQWPVEIRGPVLEVDLLP